jgi:hypothetical protein
MQPLSATMPVMVCPGNHELEPLFTAYNARFASMPGATPQWYSWEEGPVHMIQLNSFGDYAKGSVQYNWLVADLAAITPKTPWVLVQLHAPWYNSNTHHTNDGQLMRVTIESLLDAAHVAVVFAGHVHGAFNAHNAAPARYARNCDPNNPKTQPYARPTTLIQ